MGADEIACTGASCIIRATHEQQDRDHDKRRGNSTLQLSCSGVVVPIQRTPWWGQGRQKRVAKGVDSACVYVWRR